MPQMSVGTGLHGAALRARLAEAAVLQVGSNPRTGRPASPELHVHLGAIQARLASQLAAIAEDACYARTATGA